MYGNWASTSLWHLQKQERSRSTWHTPSIIIAAGESIQRLLPSSPIFLSEPWLLQLKVILLSFQPDIHQCKIITHGSYVRVKLKRQEGRNQSGCSGKERAVDSSHPRYSFPVTRLCTQDCTPCPYHSSRTSFLIQDQIQSPKMSYGKLRKALLNHAVNKKHMEVSEVFKSFYNRSFTAKRYFEHTNKQLYKDLHKYSALFQDWAYKSNSSILQLLKINLHFAFLVD